MRRPAALAAAALLSLGVAACSQDPNSVAGQAQAGDGKGYVAGDGTIQQLAAGERSGAVTVEGTTLEGEKWSLDDAKGKVVVLNVWGEWCPPCQKELPDLQKAWAGWQKDDKPVQLMGINQRDSVARAQAVLKKFDVTFPSLREDGGQALLGLQGKVQATPTTLVLDKQHRIAARVSGPVTDGTLDALVDDVLAEK